MKSVRDAVDQISALVSPCESNSCAAAVCSSVRGCVSGDTGGFCVFFDGVCDRA